MRVFIVNINMVIKMNRDTEIEKICEYIQGRLDECKGGNLKAYVNEAFLIEEGNGYIGALCDIRYGLKKKGLWQLPEDYQNPYEHRRW